jgi:hypothetical protein
VCPAVFVLYRQNVEEFFLYIIGHVTKKGSTGPFLKERIQRRAEHPRAGIFKKSMGARHGVGIGLLYRPARPHRLAEFIPWNRFRGPIHVQKYQLSTPIPFNQPIKLLTKYSRTISKCHNNNLTDFLLVFKIKYLSRLFARSQ